MLARRVVSVAKDTPKSLYSSAAQPSHEGKSGFAAKAVSFVLITVTGGVALSALDDLAIYHACSSALRPGSMIAEAMDKASKNKVIIDALGEPMKKGPWYNASLAVAHQRHSVSCTFPVSGPQGSGIFQLKAVRNGDSTWLSFWRPRDWEILIMEALLHVPENEEKQRTFRISLSDDFSPPDYKACMSCSSSEQKHGESQKSSAGA